MAALQQVLEFANGMNAVTCECVNCRAVAKLCENALITEEIESLRVPLQENPESPESQPLAR